MTDTTADKPETTEDYGSHTDLEELVKCHSRQRELIKHAIVYKLDDLATIDALREKLRYRATERGKLALTIVATGILSGVVTSGLLAIYLM